MEAPEREEGMFPNQEKLTLEEGIPKREQIILVMTTQPTTQEHLVHRTQIRKMQLNPENKPHRLILNTTTKKTNTQT